MRKEKGFNLSDYDYMDSMPLEGWIWEFIRRNKSYWKHFSLQKKDATYPFDCYGLYGLIPYRFYKYPSKNIDHKNFLLITKQLKGKEISATTCYEYFPNPGKRYCDFGTRKPFIRGLLNVKIHDFRNDSFRPDFDCNNPEYQKYCCTIVTNYLAIEDDPLSTLYLGISLKARKEDIIKDIEGILKHYKKPLKTKFAKTPKKNENLLIKNSNIWKSYLIVYDLVSKGSSYKNVSNKLSEYNETYGSEKTIETHYKAAEKLINGDYKKHLLLEK